MRTFRRNKKTVIRRAPKRRAPLRRPITVRKTSIKRMVKAAVEKEAETKICIFSDLNRPILSSASLSSFDTNNIIPISCTSGAFELEQGVGESQRVGNKVTVVSASIKGTIHANPYNASTNPLLVPTQIKMFLFYNKLDPQQAPTPAVSADFYDFDNTTTGFRNDLVDMWAPINTEKYSVLATRTFKCGMADSNQATPGNSTTGPLNYSNNDFKLNCNFSVNFTKYLPKRQTFRDNTIDSTTRQLYMMFVPCAANGAAITAGNAPCTVQYIAHLKYKDA